MYLYCEGCVIICGYLWVTQYMNSDFCIIRNSKILRYFVNKFFFKIVPNSEFQIIQIRFFRISEFHAVQARIGIFQNRPLGELFTNELLYVQEVVTQPKILNRTIFYTISSACDLKLFGFSFFIWYCKYWCKYI